MNFGQRENARVASENCCNSVKIKRTNTNTNVVGAEVPNQSSHP